MKKEEIIREIENRVNRSKEPKYSHWTVGITNDPERRKKEHEIENHDTKFWMNWKTDSETIARDVEKYFLNKEMKGDTGGGERPTWVYIF